jgi:hypothetical protein
MEIKEIVSYFLNKDSNILEVSFRTIEDNDDLLRNDQIDYTLVEDYGYELETESFDFFDEELDEDEFENKEEVELDEYELISFLNEYYTINSDLLPKANFY